MTSGQSQICFYHVNCFLHDFIVLRLNTFTFCMNEACAATRRMHAAFVTGTDTLGHG